jgi:hypothetical protein
MTEIDLDERSLENMARFYKSQLLSIHRGQQIHRTDLKNLKRLRLVCLNHHGSLPRFVLTPLARALLGVT